MKEIDFLPSWYKNDRKLRASRRTQYVLFGSILLSMVIWNFVNSGTVSTAQADIELLDKKLLDAAKVSREYAKLQSQIKQLEAKADIVATINSNLNVSATLAEISYLTGDRIALSKIRFTKEDASGGVNRGIKAIRSAVKARKKEAKERLGDSQFRVIITGIASNSFDVGDLIVRLEQSEYFDQVIPSYSRNKQVKGKTRSNKEYMVSEFELSCYLANYESEKNRNLAKGGI